MITKTTAKKQEMELYISITESIVLYSVLMVGIVTISFAVASTVYLGLL